MNFLILLLFVPILSYASDMFLYTNLPYLQHNDTKPINKEIDQRLDKNIIDKTVNPATRAQKVNRDRNQSSRSSISSQPFAQRKELLKVNRDKNTGQNAGKFRGFLQTSTTAEYKGSSNPTANRHQGNGKNANVTIESSSQKSQKSNTKDYTGSTGGLSTVYTDKDVVTIEIWDNGVEDGDIVSLKFNGKVIIKKYTLVKQRKSITLHLTQNINILKILSLAGGDSEINTAAILIRGITRGDTFQNWIIKTGQIAQLPIIKEESK